MKNLNLIIKGISIILLSTVIGITIGSVIGINLVPFTSCAITKHTSTEFMHKLYFRSSARNAEKLFKESQNETLEYQGYVLSFQKHSLAGFKDAIEITATKDGVRKFIIVSREAHKCTHYMYAGLLDFDNATEGGVRIENDVLHTWSSHGGDIDCYPKAFLFWYDLLEDKDNWLKVFIKKLQFTNFEC